MASSKRRVQGRRGRHAATRKATLKSRAKRKSTRTSRPSAKPLWRCQSCGRRFANRNQPHACARRDLQHHFHGKAPEMRALYDAFVGAVKDFGPVKVLPEKTRIAFQVRMSFAQVTPRLRWLDGHFIFARRVEHPRFRHIEAFSPRNHLHQFRLTAPSEIDAEFRRWIAEAYAVGEQQHLQKEPVQR